MGHWDEMEHWQMDGKTSQILPAEWRGNLDSLSTICYYYCYLDMVIFVSTCLRWERWHNHIASMVMRQLMKRNTLSFIVRDGDWKEDQPKATACTIENFCNVILSGKEISNSMASYTKALLKSKENNLDKGSSFYFHLDIFSDIFEQSGRGYGYDEAKCPNGLHFEVIPL